MTIQCRLRRNCAVMPPVCAAGRLLAGRCRLYQHRVWAAKGIYHPEIQEQRLNLSVRSMYRGVYPIGSSGTREGFLQAIMASCSLVNYER